MTLEKDLILILDFGSQYTQLIARRIRELGIYSLVKAYDTDIKDIQNLNPKGIIISGGPNSVNFKQTLKPNKKNLFITDTDIRHMLWYAIISKRVCGKSN